MIVGTGRIGNGYEEYVVLNKRQIAMSLAPRKYEIREAIRELRRTKELPFKNADYKPNYQGIRSIYAINTARLLKLENEKKRKNKADTTPPNTVDIVSNLYINLLKEIILCDYKHVDYGPKTDDDLLSSVTVVKRRKKVRLVLTKQNEQGKKYSFLDRPITLDPATRWKIDYDPDDDEEEREERKSLEQKRIDEMSWVPDIEEDVEEMEKVQRQLNDLSILSLNQQVADVQKRFDDIKLGLKIAEKVAIPLLEDPESGYTYKQLAFQLFPEARVKTDQELEPCIQTIARSIKAVQIYIFTRCLYRNMTIRIFPMALTSSKDGVERVFNGYKRKYIDKVLSEFIIRK